MTVSAIVGGHGAAVGGIVDAHQHVWDLRRVDYPWLTADAGVLYRSFAMGEVLGDFDAHGVAQSVLVQAADSDEETDFMLEVARAHPVVAGVVAFVPLHDPVRMAGRLEGLAREPLFCGVRNLTHNRPDPGWLLRPEVDEGLGLLEDAEIPLDVVGYLPEHLKAVSIAAERHPGLTIAIDHLNRPPVGAGDWRRWASLLRVAGDHPRVHAKLSGFSATAGNPAAWTVEDLRPSVDHALDVFGPSRLMYGGDWPVCVQSGAYGRTLEALDVLLDGLTESERRAVLAANARAFYNLPEPMGRAAL